MGLQKWVVIPIRTGTHRAKVLALAWRVNASPQNTSTVANKERLPFGSDGQRHK